MNSEPKLELALRPHRSAGFSPLWAWFSEGNFLSVGCSPDRGEHLGLCAEMEVEDLSYASRRTAPPLSTYGKAQLVFHKDEARLYSGPVFQPGDHR